MKKLGNIRQNIKNLWSCERGAVAPLVGVCAIMLVGAVAVAVDVGRGQVAQSKLQAALDSAGLAAGAVVSQNIDEDDLKPEAWKYLQENFNGETIDATIDIDDFDLQLSDDDMLVTLEARASLPTTFMRIFGHDIMHVAARTEITREMTGLEVALVLDVTGSMCDPCSKRDAMKAGAKDLVNIMFGSNATVDDLWIGIVPFAQGINIGTSRTDWLSNYAYYNDKIYCSGSKTSGTPRCPNDALTIDSARVSTTTNPLTRVNRYMDSAKATWYFRPHGWAGCVEAREADDEDVTDTPPSEVGFPVFFAPDTSYPGSNNTGTNNWRGPTDSAGSNNGQYRVNSTRSANKSCPQNAITPLTNVKATLNSAIDALQVNGYTQLPLGAAWGWRLLSPEWRGEWGGDMDSNDLPLDYDEELSQKVVIFMTDGNNDMPGEASDPDSGNRDPDNYTSYGRIGDGRIDGIVEDSAAELEMNNRFAQICNSMKDAERGITIYTISFGADVKTSSKTLLRNCASLQDYYFHAPSEEKLKEVFRAIGDALSKLRVSK
jgi:Flp pilus assembly protein TadG